MEEFFMGPKNARFCLVQPVNEPESALLQQEFSLITAACGDDVCLAAFLVRDWNGDLSPWPAAPVFGKVGFAGRARQTLQELERRFLPQLAHRYLSQPEAVRYVIGGYSLAGLFSLWAASETDHFAACAAASPSVWFPGWIDYARSHRLQTGAVYLSLGDREEKTRNPVMGRVGDCIRQQADILKDRLVILEWNKGNHFVDSEKRTARAFSWCVAQLR